LLPARSNLSPRTHWRNRRRVRRRASGRTVAYNLRFPGQIFDGQAGLHQNYFRDYDPAIGRYPTGDPIGLNGGINPYNYVGANPLSRSDPLGLCPPTELDCEQQAQEDEAVCRSLPNSTPEDKAVRSRCWASVQERFGNCSANRPLGPLVTWRQVFPNAPPPRLDGGPVPNYTVPAIVIFFLIPWPGNPVYLGL